MSVEVDISGLDRQFRELAYKTASGGKKASKIGAAIVAEKLKENTPYENNSDRKWRAQRQWEAENGVSHEFKHLRDDIVQSTPNELGEIEVKFGKDTAWRSRFVNDGTIHQVPQHFAEKTVVETHEPVKIAMQEIINRELNGL
jgi:HK97 gp10 family phage protein